MILIHQGKPETLQHGSKKKTTITFLPASNAVDGAYDAIPIYITYNSKYT